MTTDGCIKVLSVMDTVSEPTGFTSAHGGMTANVNILHSDDANVEKIDDYRTDAVLVMTDFKVPI